MAMLKPVNSKDLSSHRSHARVAESMNVWSNSFFRLMLPSDLGTKAKIKQIQDEGAKVLSMGSYIGCRTAEPDSISYDGCTYEGEPMRDETKGTLWKYSVQFPSGFDKANGENFNISLGTTFKCHDCRGQGRVKCRKCGGKVRWKERSGDDVVEYTCNCGDGKQDCSICTGFGQMQKILRVNTAYGFHETRVKEYSGRLPENLLMKSSGSSLFKYVSKFENEVVTEAIDGFEPHEFDQLMQSLCFDIKKQADVKVVDEMADPAVLHNLVDDYFDKLPNPVIANQRLKQESLPVRMKCEVSNVPVQAVLYEYKERDYSLYVYGNGGNIWIEGDQPREFTWKLGVFISVLVVLSGGMFLMAMNKR
jgi:hypothetical protein